MLKAVLLNLPFVIGYKLGIVSGHSIKEKFIAGFFKGQTMYSFSEEGKQYAIEKLNEIVRPKALERIKWHQEQGHEVVVVSASLNQWIEPWCKHLNIKCIATEIETDEDRITGRLKGKNCTGSEKVRRIKEVYASVDFEYIYAYGNSSGDKQLLEMANEKYFQYF